MFLKPNPPEKKTTWLKKCLKISRFLWRKGWNQDEILGLNYNLLVRQFFLFCLFKPCVLNLPNPTSQANLKTHLCSFSLKTRVFFAFMVCLYIYICVICVCMFMCFLQSALHCTRDLPAPICHLDKINLLYSEKYSSSLLLTFVQFLLHHITLRQSSSSDPEVLEKNKEIRMQTHLLPPVLSSPQMSAFDET